MVVMRVPRPDLAGNLMREMASSTELLPEDWSPITMICGSSIFIGLDAQVAKLIDRVKKVTWPFVELLHDDCVEIGIGHGGR